MRLAIVSFSLTLIFILQSCVPDLALPVDAPRYPSVDEELWSYFDSFEEEAANRGFTIDLSEHELFGTISEIHEDGVAGTCQYNSNDHNRITIDQTFWNNASPNLREMVVYHELGHCVLYRGHLDQSNDSGICLSIMNSGLSDCSVLYSGQNKPLYLDELFYFD